MHATFKKKVERPEIRKCVLYMQEIWALWTHRLVLCSSVGGFQKKVELG